MESDEKKIILMVTELFIRGRKLNTSLFLSHNLFSKSLKQEALMQHIILS